ncbi:hypothetical protein [Curtobacterium sp. MCSS17_016]|uniref:hypothetical protein n=1 Tax=Curtobacterium sp. MCSS17_016 TaxID=2175644 RepID=UPI000DA9283E|nr:hypothetical protein [Curtobacterium sp. MCSS17_016]WIE81491.1 hypothetical protein DEJ19_019840 [Curtobacterium sp. MCSS17_016]
MTDTTITSIPGGPVTGAAAAQKRMKNLGHADFGTSAARQAAALAWAGAEVGAELRDNTAALSTVNAALASIAGASVRQAEAAERAAVAAERTAQFTQMQTMLALYNTPEQMLPQGVREQFKQQLGITPSTADVAGSRRAQRVAPAAAPAAAASPAAPAAAQYDEFS